MQVKKFEAKSMKDALQLVKIHMGPDAIILSARDNSKNFGLMGETSVEVTAAVSENVLRRKQLAETKLNQEFKQKYSQSSAKVQKAFIQKAFEHKGVERLERPPTSRRYIEIDDEESRLNASREQGSDEQQNRAEERIKGAAARALKEVQAVMDPEPVPIRKQSRRPSENSEILSLRKEIMNLKKMLMGFQNVPQSFVTMHPGAEEGISYEMSESFQKMRRAGINLTNTVEILKKAEEVLPVQQTKKPAFIDAWIARYLLDNIKVAENRTRNKFHAFIGPSGHGKTSSLLKLASHLVICEKKKVAILTVDSIKLGAAEQLKIYAQILNVPFAVIRRQQDWEVVQHKLSQVDHILVDFPGMSLKSMSEVDWMRDLLPVESAGGRSLHYVQSVLAKDEEALEGAARYKVVGFDDVIFTNLDHAGQHGLIYNFQKKLDVPLHSFGIGSQIPEDFEPATKERVIDLIFKLTKIRRKEA